MSQTDPYTDVVELCALLQCLGFSVRSLDSSDGNLSQDGGGTRTVVINCQASGLHVVLENSNLSCSCPPAVSQQNSGFWQVSGVTGGKQFSKECGSALLGSLPKSHRDRLTKELQDIVRYIKENNESDLDKPKADDSKSASMTELKTPEKRNLKLNADTPTRCRSLDTLTTVKQYDQELPTPLPLQNLVANDSTVDSDIRKSMCQRQSTYTLSSTPGSVKQRNKTSSPIQESKQSVIDNLVAAEKMAEELRNILSNCIKDIKDEGKHESSMSSITLDVSKISLLKGADNSKIQFSSSPNLSGYGLPHEDRKLRRTESASTSNLASNKSNPKESKISKLKRISPNIFKLRNSTSATKPDSNKASDKNSKLNSLFKPKIVTPIRVYKPNPEASPNLSANRKKYSNIKSTIPRPTSRKE